ncbi:MAG: 23S rRNA (adenine(2503)-C(2))-methyltransferase RlmN [Sedimentisphaerales bacterium]|nr:23S rRNA (adenine(2503)-C(2))-methyltransferase RlmN [Sedimentisphaerales bacterium]
MTNPTPNILDHTQTELRSLLQAQSLPAFRADQILRWIYQEKVLDFQQMTNLAKPLRAQLSESFTISSATVQQTLTSDDGTIKALLRFPDDALVETVLMPNPDRNTACLSSQVGCPVKCSFCASGSQGLQRNLTPGQIVEQALWAASALPPDQRLSHIVIMGMGEPFTNYPATIKAAQIINAPYALNIAARHITISTVGLPDQIRQLAQQPLQVTLALSLHAADQSLRDQLIPFSRKYPLTEILAALQDYYAATHREVTLEYLLLADVNDSLKHAEQLAHFSRKVRSNVNLIRYNPVESSPYSAPSDETCSAFLNRLTQLGINAHLRQSRGQDIQAACGQLRRRHLTK